MDLVVRPIGRDARILLAVLIADHRRAGRVRADRARYVGVVGGVDDLHVREIGLGLTLHEKTDARVAGCLGVEFGLASHARDGRHHVDAKADAPARRALVARGRYFQRAAAIARPDRRGIDGERVAADAGSRCAGGCSGRIFRAVRVPAGSAARTDRIVDRLTAKIRDHVGRGHGEGRAVGGAGEGDRRFHGRAARAARGAAATRAAAACAARAARAARAAAAAAARAAPAARPADAAAVAEDLAARATTHAARAGATPGALSAAAAAIQSVAGGIDALTAA